MGENRELETAQNAVLVHSGPLPVEPVEIKGYDFNSGVNYSQLLKSFYTTGFQATNLAKAVDEVNRMVNNIRLLCFSSSYFSQLVPLTGLTV